MKHFSTISLNRLQESSTGVRLAYLRDKKGLNQTQLARLVGVSQSTISNIERTPAVATLDLIEKICEQLDVDWQELVADDFIDLHVDNPGALRVSRLLQLAGN